MGLEILIPKTGNAASGTYKQSDSYCLVTLCFLCQKRIIILAGATDPDHCKEVRWLLQMGKEPVFDIQAIH